MDEDEGGRRKRKGEETVHAGQSHPISMPPLA